VDALGTLPTSGWYVGCALPGSGWDHDKKNDRREEKTVDGCERIAKVAAPLTKNSKPQGKQRQRRKRKKRLTDAKESLKSPPR